MKKAKKAIILLLSCTILYSCSKEEVALSNGNDSSQESTTEEYTPRWNSVIDNSIPDNGPIFIGSKYLGVQNFPCISTPPSLYVGAVFPESSFATTFDKECTKPKHKINLTFDFSNPFLAEITPQWIEYLKMMKNVQVSDEWKQNNQSGCKFQPYRIRTADLKSLQDIETLLADNACFGKALEEIIKQKIQPSRDLHYTLGEIVFKGFTVTMDIPANGIFADSPTETEDLIYIRSLTYGATAYFVITSKQSYKEVQDFLKAFPHGRGNLKEAQIVLLTSSDIQQQATVSYSFDSLASFLKEPMDNYQYGYPILCSGYRVKDNAQYTIL